METHITNSALLVMDMQTSILRNYQDAGFTKRVAKAITHARSQKIPVIYVVVGFRPGMPEINSNNMRFSVLRERMTDTDIAGWSTIDPSLPLQPNDIIVTKRRISAFSGSDLEILIRSMGISHIILTGISTSGVVLSTTCEAADKDYRITILSDGCTDADPEVHRVLMSKIFPRRAEVCSLETWINL